MKSADNFKVASRIVNICKLVQRYLYRKQQIIRNQSCL